MDSLLDDPTIGQAMAAMDAAEASQGATTPSPSADSATTPARAGQEATTPVQTPDSPPADAPATAEPNKSPSPEPKTDDKAQGSPFAKNQQRLQGGWKALNEQKSAHQAEQAKLQTEREALVRERKAFEDKQQAANRPKYTPEDVDAAALRNEKEAEALEARGEYDNADEKRFEAKRLKAFAAELRANPPAPVQTDQQAQAAFLAEQKQWMSKAAIDFPALVKADSAEALAIKAVLTPGDPKHDPILAEAVNTNPKGLYYVGRLICAETAAAGAAADRKELGALRAKVKDLNEQLAIPGDGATLAPAGELSFEQKSSDQQEAELRQMAEQMPR